MYARLLLCLMMINSAMTQNMSLDISITEPNVTGSVLKDEDSSTSEPNLIGSVVNNDVNNMSDLSLLGSVLNDHDSNASEHNLAGSVLNDPDSVTSEPNLVGSVVSDNIGSSEPNLIGSEVSNVRRTNELDATNPAGVRTNIHNITDLRIRKQDSRKNKTVLKKTRYRKMEDTRVNIGLPLYAAIRCTRRYIPGACATPVAPTWTYECFAQNCTERLGCPIKTEANRFPSYKTCMHSCSPLVAIYNQMLQERITFKRVRGVKNQPRRAEVEVSETPEILYPEQTSPEVDYQDRGLILMPNEGYEADDDLLPPDIDRSNEAIIFDNNISAV